MISIRSMHLKSIAALIVVSFLFVNCTKDPESTPMATPDTKPVATQPVASPAPQTQTDANLKLSYSIVTGLPKGRVTRAYVMGEETHVEIQVINNTDQDFAQSITVRCITTDKGGEELSTKMADLLAKDEGDFKVGYEGKLDVILPDKSEDIGAVNCTVISAN